MSSNSFLQDLNQSQRAAVEYCDGPSLVIAGAGSGKTRVLTYKIAYLLEQGLEPWSILALTFTNKAANEMKQRIQTLVNDERARYLWMGTFHSVFLRILRAEHDLIGFSSNFTIYDASDSKSLIKNIIKELALDDKQYKPGNVQARISNAKNQLVGANEYVSNPENRQVDMRQKMAELGTIFKQYSLRCRNADAMDFDDILLYTYILFKEHEEVRRKYAERFKYILVDEYQDTNFAQHMIVQQLSRENQHVCVVGDDAQSIYSFRGANIDNILSFNKIYPDSRLFKLEQNYRSTQTIVDAANSLIHKNTGQIFKNVFSQNDPGERLQVREAYSDIEEAQIVVRTILQLRKREQLEYSAFAILYRTNAQSRVFEEELRKQSCPYKIYGGLSFYQRKEIKDIIAYFRLTLNHNDEEAFRRIVNYPARGIGNTTVQKLVDAAVANGVGVWTVVSEPLRYGVNVNNGTLNKIASFKTLIEDSQTLAMRNTADVVGKEIVTQSGLLNDIYQDDSPECKSKQENVEELINGMQEFCQSRLEEGSENVSLQDYLNEVSLLSDIDSDDGDNEHRVTLMTIHSAKGLEFHTVFVVGLEENLFPSQLASGSQREMEEERRLFYVAITRAEKHCFLSYARSRLRYGKMEFGSRSRFLGDISPEFLDCKMNGQTSSIGRHDDVQLPWSRKPVQPSFPQSSNRTFSRPSVPTASVLQQPPSGYRRVESKPASSVSNNAVASRPANNQLAAGTYIEHERFGIGHVIKVEGAGDNMKATVEFRNAGTKQLLLRFARFKIITNN